MSALYWVLYAFGLPGLILSQVILWFLWAVRLGTKPFHEGRGIFWSHKNVANVTAFRAFLRRIPLLGRLVRRQNLWGGHAMLGPGIWISLTFSERGKRHELQHVYQLFDCYFATGALALILRGFDAWLGFGFSWGAAAVLWPCGALVWLASYPAALLRGQRFYADAMVEKGAYSITNHIEVMHVGRTWETILPEVKHW